MLPYQLGLLAYFSPQEKDLAGQPVDWSAYEFQTVQELDRLRKELDSPCVLIRGGHGYLKETAVDAVFPQAPFQAVVMACMRSGFSKGFYEGGSIHLDSRMGPCALARCWLAFKMSSREAIANRGLIGLKTYSADQWDYYQWSHPRAWNLLQLLITLNQPAGLTLSTHTLDPPTPI